MKQHAPQRIAFRFVLAIGIANCFADMTYEGARSATGQFLGALGASAAAIGFTAGLGELLGYGLRSISGIIADRTGKYWLVGIGGYIVNMLAVPALALAGAWPMAAALIVTERTGRAIRKPAMDAMLSFAGKQIGHGWVFGLNEALDQTGAAIGPLVLALVLFRNGGYRLGFALLSIPALLTIGTIVSARLIFRNPQELEPAEAIRTEQFPKVFWIYLAANACIAAGLADFALIGFHLQRMHVVSAGFIPIYYAAAMASGAISGMVLGKLFDRLGTVVLAAVFVISAIGTPLVFLSASLGALAGMILWGIGVAAQGSLMRALVAGIVPVHKRSSAFGIFDAGSGVAWFGGSWLMGALYGRSITALIVFSIAAQLASIPLLIFAARDRAG